MRNVWGEKWKGRMRGDNVQKKRRGGNTERDERKWEMGDEERKREERMEPKTHEKTPWIILIPRHYHGNPLQIRAKYPSQWLLGLLPSGSFPPSLPPTLPPLPFFLLSFHLSFRPAPGFRLTSLNSGANGHFFTSYVSIIWGLYTAQHLHIFLCETTR